MIWSDSLLANKQVGPLEGFRSKAGWPFTAELKLVKDAEANNWKMEFDFGEDAKKAENDGEPVDFSGQQIVVHPGKNVLMLYPAAQVHIIIRNSTHRHISLIVFTC